MGVRIYNQSQILNIKEAGKILFDTFEYLKPYITDGIKTKELNSIAEEFINKCNGGTPCKGFEGYPAGTCISVNEELIHGIPGNKKINSGDMVSIDIVVSYNGYCADAARTFFVGEVDSISKKLAEVAEKSFFEGINFAKDGYYTSDMAKSIQDYVQSNQFSVIRDFVGHGVGKTLHEAPEVPNFVTGGKGVKLIPGMVLAVEPMIAAGKHQVKILSDGWTVVMEDKKRCAHYENTIVITDGEPEIVTLY